MESEATADLPTAPNHCRNRKFYIFYISSQKRFIKSTTTAADAVVIIWRQPRSDTFHFMVQLFFVAKTKLATWTFLTRRREIILFASERMLRSCGPRFESQAHFICFLLRFESQAHFICFLLRLIVKFILFTRRRERILFASRKAAKRIRLRLLLPQVRIPSMPYKLLKFIVTFYTIVFVIALWKGRK